MSLLTLENPVFAAYAIAAALDDPEADGAGLGHRHPDDPLGRRPAQPRGPATDGPTPDRGRSSSTPQVERSRRMQRNDLESIPAFLAAGLLFVAVAPPTGSPSSSSPSSSWPASPTPGPTPPPRTTKSAPLLLDRLDRGDPDGALGAAGRPFLSDGEPAATSWRALCGFACFLSEKLMYAGHVTTIDFCLRHRLQSYDLL